MNKILPIILIGIIVVSGFGAATQPADKATIKTESIVFGLPTSQDYNEYLAITMDNTNSWVKQPGKPLLSAYTKIFMFPRGTKINRVDVAFSEVQTTVLTKPIQPAPAPVPLLDGLMVPEIQMDSTVYASDALYPADQWSYELKAGLHNGVQSVYVIVRCHPVRYSPLENTLYWSDRIDITVDYVQPTTTITFSDTKDLVIIAPAEFETALQPLVDHKNSFGVVTELETLEEIYDEYSGRDSPEQIKYFIKDAKETWNISYVLLVGGLKSLLHAKRRDDCNQGTTDWHLPVRYTNLKEGGSVADPGFISDLYYADIYRYNETLEEYEFDDWDSNKNNIFAEYAAMVGKKDIIDLYPDVYVGRLACRNKQEVNIMVDKIITYESTPADLSWFNTMVVIGGDTFDDVSTTNIYEGEAETQKALDYMTDFEPIKIWCSNRDTGGLVPKPWDITRTVSKGCGFLAFAGHGSPERWNTYWPEEFDEKRCKGLWYYNMPLFTNRDKYPICVVGGCHNSQFNVTALCFLFDALWVYGPCPECWSWLLTRKINGGSIATLGNTGLGYGAVGNHGDLDGDGVDDPDCVEAVGGYIETQFFKAYGVDHIDILGETWGQAVTNFLNVYPGMADQIDCKTAEQWVLLGDPSLKIGGYP
jgi:hypothetical protein